MISIESPCPDISSRKPKRSNKSSHAVIAVNGNAAAWVKSRVLGLRLTMRSFAAKRASPTWSDSFSATPACSSCRRVVSFQLELPGTLSELHLQAISWRNLRPHVNLNLSWPPNTVQGSQIYEQPVTQQLAEGADRSDLVNECIDLKSRVEVGLLADLRMHADFL